MDLQTKKTNHKKELGVKAGRSNRLSLILPALSYQPTFVEIIALKKLLKMNLDKMSIKNVSKMKAIIYTEYGSPDVLQLKEVLKPIPKDNEMLIKVHATTVNRTDCGFLRAEPFIVRFFSGLFRPKVKTLGIEFAGEIETMPCPISELQKFKAGKKF